MRRDKFKGIRAESPSPRFLSVWIERILLQENAFSENPSPEPSPEPSQTPFLAACVLVWQVAQKIKVPFSDLSCLLVLLQL